MITLPQKPKIIDSKENEATFEIEACYPGYGITIGNAMRRVLLSSLPGAAITGVKIKGAQHEFSTIPNVAEDVIQIILNLKQIRFKAHTQDTIVAKLKVKGEKEVTAADIKTSTDLEVINPKAHIATITDKKGEIEMEIEVDSGLGYSSVDQRKKEKLEVGKIAIDAIFTPVRKVNYSNENMRVGEATNYDRLKITVETDGSITPKEAFLKSAKILVDHFKGFTAIEKEQKEKKSSKDAESKKAKKKEPETKKEDVTKTKVSELNLSARVINSLEEAKIKTVGGLVRKNEEDLKSIEGVGGKAVTDIKRVLGKLGLNLKE